MTDNSRIAEIEAKIAAAQAELAELKAGKAAPPPPQPPRDEGVRIIQFNDERVDGLPSFKELEQLFRVVKHLAPWPLNDKNDADRPFRGFCCCYRWLSNKGRTDRPNPKFALSFWLDQCKNWLRDRGSMVGDVDASTLVLAVYASGDIAYCSSNRGLGYCWELALGEHVGRAAAPDSWKLILGAGAAAIRPPSAPARGMAPPPSPVRIYGG